MISTVTCTPNPAAPSQPFPSLPGLASLSLPLPLPPGQVRAKYGPPLSGGGPLEEPTTRVVRGKTHNPGNNPGCDSRGDRNTGNNPGSASQREAWNPP